MSSLHIGWTILIGVMFIRSKIFIWLKAFDVLYPILTFIDIIITANHYIIDAAGGFGVMIVSYLVYEGLLRLKHRAASDQCQFDPHQLTPPLLRI